MVYKMNYGWDSLVVWVLDCQHPEVQGQNPGVCCLHVGMLEQDAHLSACKNLNVFF